MSEEKGCLHCGCELRTGEERENHVCASCFGALCDEINTEDEYQYEDEYGEEYEDDMNLGI